MNNYSEILFKLLRLGLGVDDDTSLPPKINWGEVVDLSFAQGVASLALDGLQKYCELNPCSECEIEEPEFEDLKYEWYGSVLQDEDDFHKREKVTKELSELWGKAGIATVILKGASVAKYYPQPNHRYSCDLDLFIGDWKRGCSILEKKGIDICYEVYKDAQFHIKGAYVECHRYIVPVRGNRTLLKFENFLRSLLEEGKIQISGDLLYEPPLMFNALFCIEHARGHLFHEGITLRQVCDWMMIRRWPVDWDEFWKRCDEFGFTRFAKTFDRLADLVAGKVEYGELCSIDKRVADEMTKIEPAGDAKSKSFFRQRLDLFFEILQNGWKYKAFNDVTMPVALWRQVWTHFFKCKEIDID